MDDIKCGLQIEWLQAEAILPNPPASLMLRWPRSGPRSIGGQAPHGMAARTPSTVIAWVYILRCADGSFYAGSHRGPDLARRIVQHDAGEGGAYTRRRLPVELVWSHWFGRIADAVAAERQIKGWTRAKKDALIRGDVDLIQALSRRRGGRASSDPSRPGKEPGTSG
ncbi:hypothetical protein GCM10011367_12840 [Marinicauda pacifica]|nr:GIY-YIG nuclease family protein [Marinicauda pacifica]GGE39793.1 hypothetical protein GCM10011367_12840 [Marinicauda pacifica]